MEKSEAGKTKRVGGFSLCTVIDRSTVYIMMERSKVQNSMLKTLSCAFWVKFVYLLSKVEGGCTEIFVFIHTCKNASGRAHRRKIKSCSWDGDEEGSQVQREEEERFYHIPFYLFCSVFEHMNALSIKNVKQQQQSGFYPEFDSRVQGPCQGALTILFHL